MMFYFFVQKDGNITRRGGECSVPPELEALVNELSNAGESLATAEEYDEQVIKGATAGMVPEPQPEAPTDEKLSEDTSTDV